MEDQSKEIIVDNISERITEYEKDTSVNVIEEYNATTSNKQDNSTCVSMTTNENSIYTEEKVVKVNSGIVNTDKNIDDKFEHLGDLKVERFDAYADENNKIYKKYNLRKSLTLKVTNLNEDKLFQDLQHNQKKLKSNIIHYKCDLCSETFKSNILLSSHKKTHGNKNLYTCFYCQTVFESNIDLLEHKKLHENEKCFVCKTCKMAFSSDDTYLRHRYNHLKPPYKCKECLFQTKNIKSIKAHILVHSYKKKMCNICNEMVYEKNMCNHRLTHNKIECGECGKIMKSKAYFDYHMTSHTGVKKLQCLYCGKGFANNNQLKVHTYIHTGERAYECTICQMKFKQTTDLQRHSAVHFDKRFECDYCGKKFLHKESIEFHLRLHTNYKPYKCPECPMRFVTGTHLTSHIYRRHMECKFPCDICNKKLYTKKDYVRHVKSKSHRNKMFGTNLKGN